MIYIKSRSEIECMREAGKIAGGARALAASLCKPGVSMLDIDRKVYAYITHHKATPSFLNYGGFPNSVCISINDVVIHGIPSERKLKEGDIVSIDVGAKFKGFHGDCAETVAVGEISDEAKKLIEVTKQSFFEGLKMAKTGNRLGDISNAIGTYAESFGYGVVDKYVGHGVGRELHEDPPVPNFGRPGRGIRLRDGLALAIEPMINAGTRDVYVDDDKWTVHTADGKLSAHYENTVVIMGDEPIITTIVE
ncbi:MAG: type I methionyl aminopeptidase [Clostridia bacterium]|jgi:methionyl aminopeptidase|nr:type I methionyl aminopeptidase [Clostridia bacterium]MBQ1375006.1 type I methionyl aminopeptidase [Clostridia bacterium]MBQ1434294.1 type I methionyl aminopeptidase [Clostridia bacterium]MBQ4248969.1 type I methionyl aminopeptidase [Clostridia bacterium]